MIKEKGALEFVRGRIWSNGLSVRTMPNKHLGFDLLVDGGIKVLIVSGSIKGVETEKVDIVAQVKKDKIAGIKTIYYYLPSQQKFYTNIKQALSILIK